ncbi:hybrid sensor histidine kinase/response regulator [Pseudomonas tohonis]|uniref:hybrid sensor histidine kinase/response regulator n=1 Tax=Pseudomonas tohonis TaxID=2725477 RepID=UPI001F38D40F|nr:ATP-binding protein [Pseudomonas tohonis]
MSGIARKIGLRQWIWKAFVQSALLPLILVETVLIACYLLSNQQMRDAQIAYLQQNALDSLEATANQNAQIIQDHLAHIASNTELFGHLAELALSTPSLAPIEQLATTEDGARYSPEDLGGAASFYSSLSSVGKASQERARRLSMLDPLMKEMKRHQPLISSLYFNAWDSYNRIYPWFRTDLLYPHNMHIPAYNFYYLADAAHNPDRLQRWTDVYLDPAGNGWMASSIFPVYRDGFLEGVVGMDLTVDGILQEIGKLHIGWGGYLLLVSKDMNILALPHAAEHDFDLRELTGHTYREAVRTERFKPDDFNLERRPDTKALAGLLAASPSGHAEITLRGKTHLAAWDEIQPAGWRLVALADKSEVMAATNSLAGHYQSIGYLLIAGMIGFYLCFFTYMWLRARSLSEKLRDSIDGIAEMLRRIGRGEWHPRRAVSSIHELDQMAESVMVMGEQLSLSEMQRSSAQQRLELVIESVTAGLWEYDLARDRLLFRGEFCKRFGLPDSELGRADLLSRIAPEDVPRLDAALQGLRIGNLTRIDLELRVLGPDESIIWMLCRGRILHLEQEPDRRLAAGTFVDIQVLKQVEEDLRHRTREAQAASQAKSRFISSISHELRTPLNAIHGFAQLLRMKAEEEQADTQPLDEILLASGHLGQLVDDLLDWSSLQAEAPRLTLRAVEVGALMLECSEMIRAQAETAGLDLHVALPDGPVYVMADARRLRQVLINLLSNGIKYNRPAGLLAMGTETIDGRLRLYVEDGGEGVEPALQKALFEPFQRLGKENTSIQGTGIGLSLCRELAELMQGCMGLHSEPGVGSRFWIELTLAAAPEEAPRKSGPSPLSVYYLDDQAASQQRVAQALRGLARVTPFEHGDRLAQELENELPDLLLMDCKVPGAEVTDRLKTFPGGSDVPVILLSEAPDHRSLQHYAFKAVLRKPIDIQELRELVSSLMIQEESDVL